jgi:ATP-dependent RNA helicase DDX41
MSSHLIKEDASNKLNINEKFGLVSKQRTKEEEEEFKQHLEKIEKEKFTSIDYEQDVENIIKSSALIEGLEERQKHFLTKNYNNKKDKKKSNAVANWKTPSNYLKISSETKKTIRDSLKLTVEGENINHIPPIESFKSMKLPKMMIKALSSLSIFTPTPIQMQGIPAILSGKDLLAIAGAGVGKSFVFVIPIYMLLLYEELNIQAQKISNNQSNSNNSHSNIKQGPFAVIVVPNRELANQINEMFEKINSIILPKINTAIKVVLCIGGIDKKNQKLDIQKGVHLIIGTPGRLGELAIRNEINTKHTKILVFDEADRLLDKGFDEDIKKLIQKFLFVDQVLLFSSNMPRKIQQIVKSYLINPVTINLGKSGTVNVKVRQEIEFIKEESKLLHLLETLQKTPPPVLIFCDNKNDVDLIHEYLLLKGLDACAIHGDKEQYERTLALKEIREGIKDILVCTDIVSKGVDFQNVEHIINYDLPREIENYILRLGRCGRSDKVNGLVTTYISKNADEAVLLDLKHLLISAGQSVPKLLEGLHSEDPEDVNKECPFCGVLGHKLEQCHKLEIQRQKVVSSQIKQSVFN